MCAYRKTECKISKLTGYELFLIGGNRVLPPYKRSRGLQYGNGIYGFRHASNRAMQRQCGHQPHHHRTGLHRNRVAAPSHAQSSRRKEGGCSLYQQGTLFSEEDAEVPCRSPSATTNVWEIIE